MEAFNEYTAFLWSQFQYDWSVFSNPWILYTFFPALAYLGFFFCKWWVLLVPITLPVTLLSNAIRDRWNINGLTEKLMAKKKSEEDIKDTLTHLLKG